MNNKLTNTKDTSKLLIIYQIVMYAAMISGYKGIAYYISLGVAGLFVLKIFSKKGMVLPTNKSWNDFIMFLAFYWATSAVNFNTYNFFIYFVYYILVFFPILITEYLKTNSTTDMMKSSIKVFVYVFSAFCIIATVAYISNPGLAREMASHRLEEKLAIGGGYSLAYAAAILCVYLSSKMLNGVLSVKPVYVIFCLMCAYLVFLTESALTFFAMFLGIVISFITRGDEKLRNTAKEYVKFLFLGVALIIGATLIIYNKYAISEWILGFVRGKDTNIVYSRIEEIIENLVYGRTTGHFEKRSDTLTQSIEVFLQNPFIGAGYKYGYVFNSGKAAGVGNHSEILDAFARYGIIGAYFWLMPYFRTLKQIFVKNFGCAITILFLMYFNPFLSFHSNAVMFLFIPMVEELLKRRDTKEGEQILDEVK